jgi:hypothetical protein
VNYHPTSGLPAVGAAVSVEPFSMSPFRRVEGPQAGPDALGILVPPGLQTVVILRPRAQPWDLLLTHNASSPSFREIFRDEGPRAAGAIERELVAWSQGGEGHVELVPAEGGHRLRCRLGQFAFVACRRQPGLPYEPHLFADRAEAEQAVRAVMSVLHPAAGREQEVYCNTRHFGK